MDAESSADTDTPRRFAVLLRERKLGLCDNLERWESVGAGREILEGGDTCTPVVNPC